MKTISFTILAIVLLSITSSCTKTEEYRCVCTNTITGSTISDTNIEAESQSEAASACDDKESVFFPDRCEIFN